MLDLPFFGADQQEANRIAVSANPWPGEMAVFVSPTGSEHTLSQVVPESAVIGSLLTPLMGSTIVSRFSPGETITVKVLAGSLQSVDPFALFAGANTLAVRSNTGRFELLQAQTVELVAERTYRLSGLLRGQAGTEVEAAAGADVNAPVVLLDDRVQELAGASSRLGAPYGWLVGPSRDPVDAFTYRRIHYAPGRRGLEPYRPVHLRAKTYSSGALDASWVRRDRLSDEDWNALDIPMSEDFEIYEVRLHGGGQSLILSTTEPRITISAAALAAAFANQMPTTIDVAQMSRSVGAGARTTLSLA